MPTPPGLQRLQRAHAEQLLTFEADNRAWFARTISDRGDAYFEGFAGDLDARLAEQDAGRAAFYLAVDTDGSILGRFNLVNVTDRTAEVGYRVAQRATGRGLATGAVVELCRLARSDHGLRLLRARTTDVNVASLRVLAKAGFEPVGPTEIKGQPGTRFERDAADGSTTVTS